MHMQWRTLTMVPLYSAHYDNETSSKLSAIGPSTGQFPRDLPHFGQGSIMERSLDSSSLYLHRSSHEMAVLTSLLSIFATTTCGPGAASRGSTAHENRSIRLVPRAKESFCARTQSTQNRTRISVPPSGSEGQMPHDLLYFLSGRSAPVFHQTSQGTVEFPVRHDTDTCHAQVIQLPRALCSQLGIVSSLRPHFDQRPLLCERATPECQASA